MKRALLILVAISIATAAMPAAAQAVVWTDEGLEVQGEKAVPLEGSIAFIGEVGGVQCTSGLKASVTLEGGTSKATVTEFAPDLSKCDLTGAIKTCTLTAIEVKGLPWALVFDGAKFSIPDYEVTTKLHGFLCPTPTVSGGASGPAATPDPDVTEIEELTIGGSAQMSSPSGAVSMSGTLAPTEAGDVGTYGLTNPPVWTDEGLEVQGEKAVPLEGSIAFQGSLGKVNCTSGVKASISLQGGTSGGTITEFAPDISKCDVEGGIAHCTLTAVDVKGLPWSLSFDGTKFSISDYEVTTTLEGFLCPDPTVSYGASGPAATPDPGIAEIEELTIGGSAQMSSPSGAVSMSGTLAPTEGGDVGTYGLTTP